ncbi:hypothetical protein phiOC_p111 [Ochrobactrum phage vB_OspM_OC]|nr:hypothetical protein phiOC_p111 [Ochrobactrum phage vB_OspM_OC]
MIDPVDVFTYGRNIYNVVYPRSSNLANLIGEFRDYSWVMMCGLAYLSLIAIFLLFVVQPWKADDVWYDDNNKGHGFEYSSNYVAIITIFPSLTFSAAVIWGLTYLGELLL